MVQADYNRAEEYITLREELMQLQAFARQVLYWTIILVITSFGWYLSKLSGERIPPPMFAISMYVLLWLSYSTYLIHFNQIYRIGGYMAVFWESRDADRHLKWHRFNRRGPVGGYLPDTAVLVYGLTTVMVVVFLGYFTFVDKAQEQGLRNGVLMVVGGALAVIFAELTQYLRTQRDRYELGWRLIRASVERQNEIHDSYETIPAEATTPGRAFSPRTFLLLSLAGVIVLGLLAFATLRQFLLPPLSTTPAEQRFEQLEQELNRTNQTVEAQGQIIQEEKRRTERLGMDVEQSRQKVEGLENQIRQIPKPLPAKRRKHK